MTGIEVGDYVLWKDRLNRVKLSYVEEILIGNYYLYDAWNSSERVSHLIFSNYVSKITTHKGLIKVYKEIPKEFLI